MAKSLNPQPLPCLSSDPEKLELDVLYNDSVQSYSWEDCNFQVKHRATGQPKHLLENISGVVHGWSAFLLPSYDYQPVC